MGTLTNPRRRFPVAYMRRFQDYAKRHARANSVGHVFDP
jgi:hypothetical protein